MPQKWSFPLFINMFLLSSTLTLSVTMIISSTSWFFTWMSLEVNLLTFIGWCLQQKFHEAMTKYFLIQSMGSSLFIMSSTIMLTFNHNVEILHIIPSMAILIKMGSVPFHLWYPEVMNLINWTQCMMLTTIQKVGPLFIIFQLKSNVTLFALLSTIMGALSSLNQSSLRKLLAFSSISHNGWMLMNISLMMTTWTIYFIIYSIINIISMNLMNQHKWYHLNQIKPTNNATKIMFMMSIMALGGLPPTIGFVPKWIMLSSIMYSSTLTSFILILSSLIILFAYMNMIYLSMFIIHQNNYSMYTKLKFSIPSILALTIPSIPLTLM